MEGGRWYRHLTGSSAYNGTDIVWASALYRQAQTRKYTRCHWANPDSRRVQLSVVMAEAPADGWPPDTSQRYSLDDNIGVVLQDTELVHLLSLHDPLNGGWKCLAARLNYSFSDTSKLESLSEPCKALLQDWQKKPGSTIRVFKKQLVEMNKHDVLARLDYVMKGENFHCSYILLHLISLTFNSEVLN